jgi:hypothetical protein
MSLPVRPCHSARQVAKAENVVLITIPDLMTQNKFSGQLYDLIIKAENGDPKDVDFIMKNLNSESTFAMTRYVDFSLGLVTYEMGIARIEHYLFNGSQIQRNYSSLFFNRRGDWEIVKKAFQLGLIDEIQAFAR